MCFTHHACLQTWRSVCSSLASYQGCCILSHLMLLFSHLQVPSWCLQALSLCGLVVKWTFQWWKTWWSTKTSNAAYFDHKVVQKHNKLIFQRNYKVTFTAHISRYFVMIQKEHLFHWLVNPPVCHVLQILWDITAGLCIGQEQGVVAGQANVLLPCIGFASRSLLAHGTLQQGTCAQKNMQIFVLS